MFLGTTTEEARGLPCHRTPLRRCAYSPLPLAPSIVCACAAMAFEQYTASGREGESLSSNFKGGASFTFEIVSIVWN